MATHTSKTTGNLFQAKNGVWYTKLEDGTCRFVPTPKGKTATPPAAKTEKVTKPASSRRTRKGKKEKALTPASIRNKALAAALYAIDRNDLVWGEGNFARVRTAVMTALNADTWVAVPVDDKTRRFGDAVRLVVEDIAKYLFAKV